MWYNTFVDACVLICFFFQAEDGIRDAQESRGLGDVYKRQFLGRIPGERYFMDAVGKERHTEDIGRLERKRNRIVYRGPSTGEVMAT